MDEPDYPKCLSLAKWCIPHITPYSCPPHSPLVYPTHHPYSCPLTLSAGLFVTSPFIPVLSHAPLVYPSHHSLFLSHHTLCWSIPHITPYSCPLILHLSILHITLYSCPLTLSAGLSLTSPLIPVPLHAPLVYPSHHPLFLSPHQFSLSTGLSLTSPFVPVPLHSPLVYPSHHLYSCPLTLSTGLSQGSIPH